MENFGSKEQSYISDNFRKKLNNKALNFIFLGYSNNKGYILFDINKNKNIISRNVIFDESNFIIQFQYLLD